MKCEGNLTLNLSDFDYFLPKELIAQEPLRERDQARLLVVDRARQTMTHDIFAHLGRYLPANSLIVVNDSKVMPVRLLGRREKTGGRVEIFLLRKLSDGFSYQAMIQPLKKLGQGEKIIFNGGKIFAHLTDPQNKIVSFNTKNLERTLSRIGHMPLPPYIKREDTPSDRRDYQTVYARHPGSVAAPTAGLHFTRRLLRQLKQEGHTLARVTLHVNEATFRPVKVEDITGHTMTSEEYCVSPKELEAIQRAQRKGCKIVAVGTTGCRVLETVAATGRATGETNLFIYPGYRFLAVDILLTNFHLPRTTLLMLVYAFGSPELMRRAYAEAIQHRYRFYSYGDAMMIL